VQRGPAHDLHVEVPFAEHPVGRLPDGRERLGQQRVETLPVLVALLEVGSLTGELVVAHGDEVLFDRVDLVGDLLQLLEDPAFPEAQQPVHQCHVN